MDLKTTFRTSLIIAKEEIYQGQKEKAGASQKGKVTNWTLLVTNLSMLPLYAMLSFFLAGTQIGMGVPVGAFSLLLLVQLFMSFLVTLNWISTFKDLETQKPLLSLPISREYIVVSLAWLLSGGIAILIIPIPAASIFAWTTGNYLSILISFLWGCLTVLLGHSLGLFLTNAFSFGLSERSTFSKIIRSLKIGGALLLFFLWFFISTREGALNPVLEPLNMISESVWFLYPFSASKSIVNFSSIYFLSFFLYGFLFIGIYQLAGSRTWKNMVQPSFAVSEKIEKFSLEVRGKFESLIRKDLTLSFRSGQQLMGILIFPLMILFINLVDVVLGGSISIFRAEMIYLAVGVMSGWGILNFYVLEGESAWVMSSLPISRKEFAIQKALSSFTLFPFYIIPAILFVSIMMNFGIIPTLMQSLSAFTIALTSCLIISKSLINRVSNNPTVITQETFGTRLTPLIILLKSALLTGWPVITVTGLFLLIGGLPTLLLESIVLLTLITIVSILNLLLTLWRYDLLEVFIPGSENKN